MLSARKRSQLINWDLWVFPPHFTVSFSQAQMFIKWGIKPRKSKDIRWSSMILISKFTSIVTLYIFKVLYCNFSGAEEIFYIFFFLLSQQCIWSPAWCFPKDFQASVSLMTKCCTLILDLYNSPVPHFFLRDVKDSHNCGSSLSNQTNSQVLTSSSLPGFESIIILRRLTGITSPPVVADNHKWNHLLHFSWERNGIKKE